MTELELAKEEHLWLVVPKAVAFKYVKEEENLAKLRKLFAEKKVVNPIFMKGDLKPKRFFAMAKNYVSHFVIIIVIVINTIFTVFDVIIIIFISVQHRKTI